MRFVVALVFVALSSTVYADVESNSEAGGLQSKAYRTQKHYALGFNFSPLDMWVPFKWGANFSYTPTEKVTWELEYIKGSVSRAVLLIDIGRIEDERVTLMRRSFAGRNSLNFIWGLYYERFSASLGNDFLATVTGVPIHSVDMLEVTTLGVSWGVGNRWHTQSGVTIGFDWFTINIPILTDVKEGFTRNTTDPKKRNSVKNVLDKFENIPTLGLAKIQIGYSF